MSEADDLRAFFAAQRPPPPAQELARRLPAMTAPAGPYEGAREQPKFATIPEHVVPQTGQPLPPPMDPNGSGVGSPDAAAYMRQKAMIDQQKANALMTQRPGFAAIPHGTILTGGALPPPLPPGQPSLAPTPEELETMKARLAAKGEHCDCKEKA